MGWRIDNGVIQDDIVIDGEEYTINTYIEGEYHLWGTAWVTWLIRFGEILHETKITEHTLEAAEATHKYVVEHAEEILREREMKDGPYF